MDWMVHHLKVLALSFRTFFFFSALVRRTNIFLSGRQLARRFPFTRLKIQLNQKWTTCTQHTWNDWRISSRKTRTSTECLKAPNWSSNERENHAKGEHGACFCPRTVDSRVTHYVTSHLFSRTSFQACFVQTKTVWWTRPRHCTDVQGLFCYCQYNCQSCVPIAPNLPDHRSHSPTIFGSWKNWCETFPTVSVLFRQCSLRN